MSASASEIPRPVVHTNPVREDPGYVLFTLRISPADAALVRHAAAGQALPVTQFMLHAILAEAQRMTVENPTVATATTGSLVLINEVFDRLAVALGESEKSLNALGELIWQTNHRARP